MFTLVVLSLGNSFIRHNLRHNRPIMLRNPALVQRLIDYTDCMTFMFSLPLLRSKMMTLIISKQNIEHFFFPHFP